MMYLAHDYDEHNEPNDPHYHYGYDQILISFQHVSKNTFVC